jgi:hypothetical protein
MDVEQQITTIIQYLEEIREHPAMYIGTPEPANIEAFLASFRNVCEMAGFPPGVNGNDRSRIYEQVITERGWQTTSTHISSEMHARKCKPAKIYDETIAVEIEIWKRLYGLA